MNARLCTALLVTLATLGLVYGLSYAVISRRGFAEARKTDSDGFYYLPPMDSDGWRRRNSTLRLLFTPINLVDQMLGTGRAPSSEPLWDID